MQLFKYLSPARLDVLKSQMICFSSADNLNDPYELAPFFKGYLYDDGLRKSLVSRRDKEIERQRGSRDEAELERIANKMNEQIEVACGNTAELMTRVSAGFRHNAIKHVGLLSLSVAKNHPLMWAHYGVDHTGFMMEFDADHPFFHRGDGEQSLFGRLRKVEYSKLRPVVYCDGARLQEDIFLVKSEHWEYEAEWRMFLNLKNADYVVEDEELGKKYHLFSYPIEAVKSVTLGCRMKDETKDAIRKILAAIPEASRPKCLIAKLHVERFEVVELEG
ncbi:DUF2971 domain-containing protein [Pseudomonas spirodelae]|uniref:DUF2971 domain-containing protein n=1 Tax=Pseudomonas spirodelae TaxID=3101751 RepID=A0ABU5P809_9PSED|nr:DUF2971 domain-containing protein [Pseudomonas sp. T5W1]MEA1605735.1 DUF2971 domain-containing protein [Pseudomonas sp. T5W1]